MLIDLLNASNYVMINMDAIHIFGITTAAYCSELLTIYKKAVTKNKLFNEKYFKIDRSYISKRLDLSVEEQLICDANLMKVSVIEKDAEDPDLIFFNVETFTSIVASEDVRLIEKVSKKVKVANPKGVKQAAKDRIIIALKESIECRTPEVLFALRDWIDSVVAVKALSKPQVRLFKDTLDDYCNGDINKALEIIKIATIHQYQDCQWAINLYERGNKPVYKTTATRAPLFNVADQKVTSVSELGEETF